MKKVFFTTFILVCSVVFVSCKKETETPPTKTELLTDGAWTGVKSEYYEDNILIDTELIPDDVFDFKSNGTMDYYYESDLEGVFNWSFNNNETVIIIDFGDGGLIQYDIETLSNSVFTFSETYIDDGVEARAVIYLGR